MSTRVLHPSHPSVCRLRVRPAQLHRRNVHVGLISAEDGADFYGAQRVVQPSVLAAALPFLPCLASDLEVSILLSSGQPRPKRTGLRRREGGGVPMVAACLFFVAWITNLGVLLGAATFLLCVANSEERSAFTPAAGRGARYYVVNT